MCIEQPAEQPYEGTAGTQPEPLSPISIFDDEDTPF